MASPFRLDGKCAVVTGGTQGLGCVFHLTHAFPRPPLPPTARSAFAMLHSRRREASDDVIPLDAF